MREYMPLPRPQSGFDIALSAAFRSRLFQCRRPPLSPRLPTTLEGRIRSPCCMLPVREPPFALRRRRTPTFLLLTFPATSESPIRSPCSPRSLMLVIPLYIMVCMDVWSKIIPINTRISYCRHASDHANSHSRPLHMLHAIMERSPI